MISSWKLRNAGFTIERRLTGMIPSSGLQASLPSEPMGTTMTAKCGAEDRGIDLRKIASQLGATRDELVRTLGVEGDADGKHLRGRIRQMLDVLCKVEPRFGSARLAYAWYRSEPLPGFSGLTAMELVRRGRVEDVLTTIDAVNVGIQA